MQICVLNILRNDPKGRGQGVMTPRDGVKGSFLAGKNDPLSPSPRVILLVALQGIEG